MFKKGFKFKVTHSGITGEVISARDKVNYFGERFVYTVRFSDGFVTSVFEDTIADNIKYGVYEEVPEGVKFFSEFGSVYKMDYSQWDNNIEWTFKGLFEDETGEQFEIWESEGRYRWEEMDDEYYEDDEDI